MKYTGENPFMQVNSFVMYVLKTGLTSVSKWTGKRWALPSVRGRCCPLPHMYTQSHFKRSIADEIYGVGSWWDRNPVPVHGRGGLSLFKPTEECQTHTLIKSLMSRSVNWGRCCGIMSYRFPVFPRSHSSRILHSHFYSHSSPLPPFVFSDIPSPSPPQVSAAQTFFTPLPHSSPILAAAAQQCYFWSMGLCAAFPSPLLLMYLSAASWDISSWTRNLSWARKLRSSKSSEKHLMIKYFN